MLKIQKYLIWIGLFFTTFVVFVPLQPNFPELGLDNSWFFALNQGVAQKLSFGRDLIFTCGPYAAIYTKSYHPSTDLYIFFSSMYLAIVYCSSVLFLWKNISIIYAISFCIILVGFVFTMDPILLSYPLLLSLLTIKSIDDESIPSTKLYFLFFLISSVMGLLPLIKGSVFFVVIFVFLSSLILLCFRKRFDLVAIIFFGSSISIFTFWIIAGQNYSDLYRYLIGIGYITNGYSEAMSTTGNVYELGIYLLASVVLLSSIIFQREVVGFNKIYLLGTYTFFLFIVMKGSFVRHDMHALIAGSALIISIFYLIFLIDPRVIIPKLVIIIITAVLIFTNHENISIRNFQYRIFQNYAKAFNGIVTRVRCPNCIELDYNSKIEEIKNSSLIPILQGTSDIYSYGQTSLIASGNLWNPRPVFQSHSAYTKKLANLNKQHLILSSSPDNVFFKIEPIDNRLPSTEDGISWSILLNSYYPFSFNNDYLILKKQHDPNLKENFRMLNVGKRKLGETFSIPKSKFPVFMKIEIEKTIIGKIKSFLFKPDQLTLKLNFNSGAVKKYRVVSGMIDSVFLISPLIENTSEFGMLYIPSFPLQENMVNSIILDSEHYRDFFWKETFKVEFFELNIKEKQVFSTLDKIDLSASKLNIINASQCLGNLDKVNNFSPPPSKLVASKILKLNGWIFPSEMSIDQNYWPYLSLIDNKGRQIFIKAHKEIRNDVAQNLNDIKFNHSGYSLVADVSNLKGDFQMHMAIKAKDKIIMCPQLAYIKLL